MYINVHLIRLGNVREVVVENEDGGHSVFIDDQLSPEGRKDALRHALRHIERDDFGKHGNVGTIENEAHKKYPEGLAPGDRF